MLETIKKIIMKIRNNGDAPKHSELDDLVKMYTELDDVVKDESNNN